MVMLSTTMGFGELRQLRRQDVDMVRGCVTVREGAKNSYRQRTIPLNAVALESMTWIPERWKKFGGSDDEHYILRIVHEEKELPTGVRRFRGSWTSRQPQRMLNHRIHTRIRAIQIATSNINPHNRHRAQPSLSSRSKSAN
jgi:integrase